MNRIGQFVSDVFDILKIKISGSKIEDEYNANRTSLYIFTIRDSLFLGDSPAYLLREIILNECSKNEEIKKEIVKYLDQYLSKEESKEYKVSDFDSFVTIAISKFINPNNKDFLREVNNKPKKSIVSNDDKYIVASKIKELYKKTLDYRDKDIDVVFMYAKNILESIEGYISHDKDVDIDNIYPTKISIAMENIKNTLEAFNKGL
ncbi:MAG: hypothetical protein ABF289_07790, partial [Clostridiales bacterium]